MNSSLKPTAAGRIAMAALTRPFSKALAPHILLRSVAVLLLLLIWGGTWQIIKSERKAAEHLAAASSRKLTDIYEAQVTRVLREIDQTLRIVKYTYNLNSKKPGLQELRDRDLLPPDLWFVVSVTDERGDVVASTSASAHGNVAEQDYFEHQRRNDSFFIGRPQRGGGPNEWVLNFSRKLTTADGKFSGIATVSVLASYFVSGYEPSQLGKHGMLGILGTDGLFRVRRSGATISAGDRVDYATIIGTAGTPEDKAALTTNPWDGVRRYTAAHQLYGFPLAVVVGLSESEQLETTQRNERTYIWSAGAVSILLMAIATILDRMSRQLALSRLLAIEEQIAHSKHVEHLAYHDSLTTLPNRSFFSKLLSQGITQAKRNNRQLALLFLDIDRFKHINDTLGHEAGDKLLQEVASRLKGCLRESDTVARLGGDEFVVLLPELHEEMYAATVAQKILAAVAQPFFLVGQEFRVTTSIGISTYPQAGLDEQTLTKSADVAMYQAKARGKNNYQFYSEQLSATSLQRVNLESGLRQALEKNEFRLDYQPKQNIRTGEITGMEALLRWEHPNLGIVTPGEFIPIAEESNLILSIGRWMLRSACAQNVVWRNQGLPNLLISVNLTARQFADANLPKDLKAILAETGMDANLLELEISESVLLRDIKNAVQILTLLRNIGVRIAIDDFGMGYSLLAATGKHPFDTVKLDRSIIGNLAGDSESQALASSVIRTGKALSLAVVAQGETKEQADFMDQNTLDEYQGFYVNGPLPPDEIAELLRAQPNVPRSHESTPELRPSC